jgi:hypothetical protein
MACGCRCEEVGGWACGRATMATRAATGRSSWWCCNGGVKLAPLCSVRPQKRSNAILEGLQLACRGDQRVQMRFCSFVRAWHSLIQPTMQRKNNRPAPSCHAAAEPLGSVVCATHRREAACCPTRNGRVANAGLAVPCESLITAIRKVCRTISRRTSSLTRRNGTLVCLDYLLRSWCCLTLGQRSYSLRHVCARQLM